ncbi:uncharacterized protein LOC109426674 isoform X1 [Aedes albopictus]|uniref:DUF4806 domain-containing protein n=1 Tax=Aedes albopictus TaxID=7160 RepID=A0ABM1XQ81_AEDAL|nr:uncharacterized protein LOC109426674 isoform X1 [Aedes albopictus]
MDEFVENLLRKWNLVDLVDRFRDEEVNEEAFLLLTPEIIKELIPKLGRRAIFTARFNEFKESLQASEEPPVPVASASASPTPPVEPRALPPAPTDSFHATEDTKASLSVDNAKQFEKYFLEQLSPHPSVPSECVAVPTPAGPSTSEVDCDDEPSNKRIKLESLEVDDYGDSILLEDSSQDSESLMVETSYSMNKTMEDPLVPGVEKLRLLLQQSPFARYLLGLNELDKSNRTDLTNVVVQYMYSNQQCDGVRSHMFNYWADAIVSLFPSEIKENYFSAKEGCTSRLQARYSYLLRVRKNESSRQPGPSQSSSSRTVEENVLPDERSTFVHPGEQQIVEELRQIVSSCFVMRDTLHAKTLTPNQRNILTANIVNYLMDKNGGPISLQELELYAKAIEHIFPNENASIYFRRKGACSRVNGKLFDRYGYMKRKRSLAQGKAYSDFLDSNTPIGRLWEMKTVEEARALWNETYKARKEVSRKVVPAKLLEQFPFLAQPDGYTLFLDDFDQDHPHAIDTFKRHWPEFAASIYRYIEENNFLKGFTEFNTEGSSKPADNYTIVDIIEGAETHLYSLPSKWVHRNGWNRDGKSDESAQSEKDTDLCYWPRNAAGYRLLERGKEDPSIEVNRDCLIEYRCKIAKSGFTTFEEAYLEQQMMEMDIALEKNDPRRESRNRSVSTDKPSISNRDDKEKSQLLEAVNLVSRTVNDASVQVSLQPTVLQKTVDELQAKLERIEVEFKVFKAQIRAELASSLQEKTTPSAPEKAQNHVPTVPQTIPPAPMAPAPVVPTSSIPVAPVQPVNRITTPGLPMERPLTPVKNLEDLEALQERARDEQFVETIVHSLGIVHGQGRSVGNGWTVSLQTVDYFFDRRFLLRCSWTGSGRNREKAGERISKIAFHKYDKVINLFYRVIVYSDPLFTFNDCMKFLHRCIRNAKARAADVKGMRLSVARNRKKRSERIAELSQILPIDPGQMEHPEEYYYQVEPLVKDEYVDESVDNQFDVL